METCAYCGGQMEAIHSLTCQVPGEFADAFDYVCPACD